MDHNLSLYGVGIRYFLCLLTGMIGGLVFSSSNILGYVLMGSAIIFFLEAILAYSPLVHILGKNNSKDGVKDFN